jgi:hypothetical protein
LQDTRQLRHGCRHRQQGHRQERPCLTKERFCERNGRIAKQFEVEAVWEDGTTAATSLSAKPDLNSVELVKYIPQTYLEKVCTETEPGQGYDSATRQSRRR